MPKLGPFDLEYGIIVSGSPSDIARIKREIPELDQRIESTIEGLYKIAPSNAQASYFDVLRNNSTAGEAMDGHGGEKSVLDFVGSAKFYGLFGKKKGAKIVSDDYSIKRAEILFGAFSELEVRLRVQVLTNSKLVRRFTSFSPLTYRSEGIDHKVAYMTLFELTTEILLSPCSDEYYLDQIRQSDMKSGALRNARKLTMVDELDFPLKAEDLTRLREIRNACMHFKVVTHEDLLFVTSKINEYIRQDIMGETIRIIENVHMGFQKRLLGIANIANASLADQLYGRTKDILFSQDKDD